MMYLPSSHRSGAIHISLKSLPAAAAQYDRLAGIHTFAGGGAMTSGTSGAKQSLAGVELDTRRNVLNTGHCRAPYSTPIAQRRRPNEVKQKAHLQSKTRSCRDLPRLAFLFRTDIPL
jgi:hypothetical protein